MESQCDFLMYFPAAPISTLSDAVQYASLPRRTHVYVGETVQFLLVLRSRSAEKKGGSLGELPWKDQVSSLSALASVCDAESGRRGPGDQPDQPDLQSSCSEASEGGGPGAKVHLGSSTGSGQSFKPCSPLLSHQSSTSREVKQSESALVLENQLIFCLTVSLDKLPVDTRKAKVVVTVWKQEEEKGELLEHGYLTLLQLRSPTHTFRQDLSTFKTQVCSTLDVLPPPSIQCQQITISGKHLTVLKVLNCSSKEEMCVREVRIFPNYNSSYLPMMPDGSVLIVDNVCHQSAEVTVASFCRIKSKSSSLPSMLSALEEQNFLFQLQLQDKPDEDSSEGLEVPLLAVLQWYSPTLHITRCISTCYSLPSICLDRPRLLMTASCPRTVKPLEHFRVKYTLMNNLQDFLTVRLIWNSKAVQTESQEDANLGAVVCQSPFNNLGQCLKGSTLSFAVAFQILHTGLFELGQHMKLKLQFTTSVSMPPVAPQSPLRSSPSSSSPAVRESLDRHDVGRSHSFSHQQPCKWHHFRSGSLMEGQPLTPPLGLVPGSDHTFIPLDKVAKRECKVLVL